MNTKHPLKHFASHGDQDRKDLQYGQQLDACSQNAEQEPTDYVDASITGGWTPEED